MGWVGVLCGVVFFRQFVNFLEDLGFLSANAREEFHAGLGVGVEGGGGGRALGVGVVLRGVVF